MSKKLTQEEFIRRAREVHGNRYDYSEVNYKGMEASVCIICPTHGKFWQRAANHLKGRGCQKCAIEYKASQKRFTTQEFINKAVAVHGDKYDYSLTDYKGSGVKVTIICSIHGEFRQRPSSHLFGQGCPECGMTKALESQRTSFDLFVAKAKKVHKDKYKYPVTKIKNVDSKITILCPIHGEFKQTPYSHLKGCGCPECGKYSGAKLRTHTFKSFIDTANEVHKNKYDYSKSKYINKKAPICIICPEHGEFLQVPITHLKGCGCPRCASEQTGEKLKIDFKDFVDKANKVHNNKYEYVPSEYKKLTSKTTIICPIHGAFIQKPSDHLLGCGCPQCKESHGEREIAKWLDCHNIEYQRQFKVYPEPSLFGRNRLRVDFFLPYNDTFIEFNGSQHYNRAVNWHTEEQFAEQQDRDHRLREYCKQNKIRLIEIPYTDIDNIDKILTKKILKPKKK